MTLGIGIITYSRPRDLIRTVGSVLFHTKSPYYLVVADDGSTDATVDHMLVGGIPIITGKNRGVCWNKNRALYALLNKTNADPIILIEDDCYPTEFGWEEKWIEAAQKHHHVNFQHDNWQKGWCRGGSGTPDDPWLTWEITGQATITTRAALQKVGYLNTKFQGYGYGHIEWTERFCKAGFIDRERVPCMRSGLTMEDGQTFRKKDDITRNYYVAQELRARPYIYCTPVNSAAESEIMSREVDRVAIPMRRG